MRSSNDYNTSVEAALTYDTIPEACKKGGMQVTFDSTLLSIIDTDKKHKGLSSILEPCWEGGPSNLDLSHTIWDHANSACALIISAVVNYPRVQNVF